MSDPSATPRSTVRKRRRRSFGKIKKLPSGHYQASYIGPDGERHNGPVTFLLKQNADQWIAMRQAEIDDHSWKPPARRPKASRRRRWRTTRRRGWSPDGHETANR